jgi:hypothetical protein
MLFRVWHQLRCVRATSALCTRAYYRSNRTVVDKGAGLDVDHDQRRTPLDKGEGGFVGIAHGMTFKTGRRTWRLAGKPQLIWRWRPNQ